MYVSSHEQTANKHHPMKMTITQSTGTLTLTYEVKTLN